MIILGIGGILGNAASAIGKDGRLVAAVEEVKVSRQYRVGALPEASITACLSMAGAKPEDVPDAMALYGFPSLQEQASPAWLGGGANGAASKALAQQANFLKDQGRLTSVAPDFSKNVTTEWVTKAQ